MKSLLTELVLVPNDVWSEYKETHPPPEPEKYVWRHLAPRQTQSQDPLKKAKAAYNLINPSGSPSWDVYISQRAATEKHLEEVLDALFSETLVDQIKEGVLYVLDNTILEENQQLAIADGVLPLRIEVIDSFDELEVGFCDSLSPYAILTLSMILSPAKRLY